MLGVGVSLRALRGSAAAFNPSKLFANGEEGAWYEAFDLDTLFQESRGETPVTAAGQPVGLMYDKSEGLELGPELVTNGTFDTDVSGWDIVGSGTVTWNSGGTATFSRGGGNATDGVRQSLGTLSSGYYIFLFDLISSRIDFDIQGISGLDVTINTPGSKSFVFYNPTNNEVSLFISPVSGCTIDNISIRELPGNHALQATAAARPTYQTSDDRLTMDKVDDVLVATLPAIDGTMVLATPEGTAAYGVNISAGNYDIGGRGGDYFPGSALVGQVIRDGAMTQNEIDQTIAYFRANGGGESYGSVTNFSSFWRDCRNLTSFPLIDTSSGTNFSRAWQDCSNLTSFPLIDTSSGTNFSRAWYDCVNLTSFPLIDTSSGTNFLNAWRDCASLVSFPSLDFSSATNFKTAWYDCSSLTTFPANMFDTCTATQFESAFLNTNLSQTSIDNILLSINTANTSNGTFDQSGGSAPSATGEAAIDALRARGWTVTVTGGY